MPILLAIVRISICFLPQTGYLHPDEFFQSSDIVGGNYFESKIHPVWEFTTNKPIRCMLVTNLLHLFAFKLAQTISSKPSAYLLIVLPRLIYTLLTFTIDWSLYKLCQYYSSRGLWYLPISVIFQTSFVCLGCLTRTFSNTIEVILFSLLLVVVCQTIRPTFRILFVTPTRSTPVNERIKTSKQLTSSILVGFLITLGTFNRPTFPCFAVIPGIYWIVQSFKRNSHSIRLTIQRVIVPLTLSGLLTAILISAYDTVYYNQSFDTISQLLDHLSNYRFDEFYSELKIKWVLTPYNFIVFNTNSNNLSKFGLHMPYVHTLVNMPLAFNVLCLMFYRKLLDLLTGSCVYRLIFSTHRVYALMILTIISSLILLSFIPHQEFRFLLPLIVPLVYSFSYNIYTSNRLFLIWLLINIITINFYSSIHQSGVMKACLDLDKVLKNYLAGDNQDNGEISLMNVLAFRCYLVPSYQWNIPRQDQRFNFDLQDTFSDFNSSLSNKLENVFTRQTENPIYSQNVYMMMPRIYMNDLIEYLESQHSINTNEQLQVVNHYSMHFSGEDLSKSFDHLRSTNYTEWTKAFGFSLLKLNLT